MKKLKTIGIRIDEETFFKLKELCKKEKLNYSQCLRDLIRSAYHFND